MASDGPKKAKAAGTGPVPSADRPNGGSAAGREPEIPEHAGGASTGAGARRGGRLRLPRSGLAEEILGALEASEEQREAATTAPTGPDRIYDFADSLARSGGETGFEKKEEALETWVTFVLAGESFGLPVSHVQEILRVTGITRVPHAPNPVRGVANMRGRVLPVVDLRLRLGIPPKELDAASRILVVESKGRLIGLLVDAVQQVVRLARSGIQPPPPDVMTAQSDYISGVYHLQDALVILLVVEKVLVIQESLQGQ